jgi:hypothetical protein
VRRSDGETEGQREWTWGRRGEGEKRVTEGRRDGGTEGKKEKERGRKECWNDQILKELWN